MQYFSLAKNASAVDFKTATILGQAPDKGLYFPEQLPVLSPDFVQSISTISKNEMAFKVMKPYVGNTIPDDVLQNIVHETLDFEICGGCCSNGCIGPGICSGAHPEDEPQWPGQPSSGSGDEKVCRVCCCQNQWPHQDQPVLQRRIGQRSGGGLSP